MRRRTQLQRFVLLTYGYGCSPVGLHAALNALHTALGNLLASCLASFTKQQ